MRWIYASLLLALGLTLGGCRNDCQNLCLEMADLYDDCGLAYTQNDLLTCFEDYGDPSEAELQSCAESKGQLEEVLSEQSESGDVCEVLE